MPSFADRGAWYQSWFRARPPINLTRMPASVERESVTITGFWNWIMIGLGQTNHDLGAIS